MEAAAKENRAHLITGSTRVLWQLPAAALTTGAASSASPQWKLLTLQLRLAPHRLCPQSPSSSGTSEENLQSCAFFPPPSSCFQSLQGRGVDLTLTDQEKNRKQREKKHPHGFLWTAVGALKSHRITIKYDIILSLISFQCHN